MRVTLICHCFAVAASLVAYTAEALQYEINGTLNQLIVQYNGSESNLSYGFTVYVRDRAWLIRTTETDAKGGTWQREVGSADGTEICESTATQAFVSDTGLPVDLLDRGVVGHLWLMFASQWYWTNLNTHRLTPIFDWHASVGANPKLTVDAEWELLDGPGSLPLQVRYLGEWDETNGLYTVTATNFVGGVLIPTSFRFEERYAVPHEGMVLRKRVEAEVTSSKPTCSRKSLLPLRPAANLPVVDWRLKDPSSGNRIPTYVMENKEPWPSIDEARRRAAENGMVNFAGKRPPRPHQMLVRIVLCALAFGPPSIYFFKTLRRRRQKGDAR